MKKSRSPAPGKKSAMGVLGGTKGKRSELQELPPLDSLPDGDTTHFVGGWSAHVGFADAVTAISDSMCGGGDTNTTTTNGSQPPSPTAAAAAVPPRLPTSDEAAEAPYLQAASALAHGRFALALRELHPATAAATSGDQGTNANGNDGGAGGDSESEGGATAKSNLYSGEEGQQLLAQYYNADNGSAMTQVIVLPSSTTDAANNKKEAPVAAVAKVSHGMFISGMEPAVSEQNHRRMERALVGDAGDGDGITKKNKKPRNDDDEDEDGDAANDADEDGEEENHQQGANGNTNGGGSRYALADPTEEEEEDDYDNGGESDGGGDGSGGVPASPQRQAKALASLQKKGHLATPDGTDHLLKLRGTLDVLAAASAAACDPQRPAGGKANFSQKQPPTLTADGRLVAPQQRRDVVYRRHLQAVPLQSFVHVNGPLTIEGTRPTVAVPPEAVTPARVAAVLGSAANPVDAKGKPRRKTEEEKQHEAEVVARLEAESAAAAAAEEDRLNALAMPERWPTVFFSQLVFAGGPIVIKGCHARFYHCHFSSFADAAAAVSASALEARPRHLVSITQYCRVEFVECTFQRSGSAAVYAFPTSELFLQRCHFYNGDDGIVTTVDEALQWAVTPPTATTTTSAANANTINDAATVSSSCNTRRNPATKEVLAPQRQAATHLQTVAVHADAAKTVIQRCLFEGFDSAVVVRGRFKGGSSSGEGGSGGAGGDDEDGGAGGGGVGDEDGSGSGGFGVGAEPNEEGRLPVRLPPATSRIDDCVFLNCFSSGLSFVGAKRVSASKNYFDTETTGGLYAVQCHGDGCQPQLTRNTIRGVLLVGRGARPFLHSNTLFRPLVDKNVGEASYMSPTY